MTQMPFSQSMSLRTCLPTRLIPARKSTLLRRSPVWRRQDGYYGLGRLESNPDPGRSEAFNAIAAEERVPMSHVLVDEDGVGVVDHLACKGFVGASSPIRDEQGEKQLGYKVNYQNLRSQAYYTLAEYADQHKIAVPTENTEYRQFITEELEQIKGKDTDVDGKLKIIGKDEIKEFLGRSTDFADCLSMRMWFELDKTPVPGIRWI